MKVVKTQATELLQLFRPEFADWLVRREDGRTESFDPLTLATSFIESEIDISSAVALFDQVVESLQNQIESGELTHAILHCTVIACLLKSPDPRAPLWLANYDNLFGPDMQDLSPEKGYVNVRSISDLKANLMDMFASLLGKKTREEVADNLGDRELDAVIARIIRIVRYCGFYCVKRSFLQTFVEELAGSSAKTFLSFSPVSPQDLQQSLEQAEDLFLVARKAGPENKQKQLILLRLGLEEMAAATLQKFHYLPHRTSLTSFDKFIDVLAVIKRLQFASSPTTILPHVAAIKEKIEEALRCQGIPITSFIETCNELQHSMKSGFTQRACTQALDILGNLRIIFFPSKHLDRMHSYHYPQQQVAEYLALAAEIFSEAGINAVLDEALQRLDVAVNFGFHELLEYGQRLAIRCNFTQNGEGISTECIKDVMSDITRQEDAIPVILMNEDMTPFNRKQIPELAARFHRLVCVFDRMHFERIMRRPKDIRDEVLRIGDKLIPEAIKWRGRIFPSDEIRLPVSLEEPEKSIFAEAAVFIRQDKGAEACRSVAILHEAVLKEMVLFILALRRHGFAKEPVRIRFTPEATLTGIGAYINWLREFIAGCEANPETRKQFAGLLPTRRILDQCEALRKSRNDYMHMDREVEAHEARHYISEAASSVATLRALMSSFERAVLLDIRDDKKVFFRKKCDDIVEIRCSMIPQLDLALGCCVYLTQKPGFNRVLPALAICEECHVAVLLDGCGRDGQFRCANCKEIASCERTWHRIVKDGIKHMQRLRTRKVLSNMESDHRIAPTMHDEQPVELSCNRSAPSTPMLSASSTHGGRPAASYDVFLSHNSKDKVVVRQLATALMSRGLRVWLDEWDLIPGRPWQEALEQIIQTAGCAAVLVGTDGLGPWEIPEMRACLIEFVNRHLPVIPVLLPYASMLPDLPLFLKQFTWVDLRSGLTKEGLDRLEWGITGRKPNP